MQLTLETDTALNEWVGSRTWDSDRPVDRRRFYRFVDQFKKDHGYSMKGSYIRALIEQKVRAKGHRFGPHEEERVHEYLARARNILDFAALINSKRLFDYFPRADIIPPLQCNTDRVLAHP